jgi:hypothetical protein
MRINISVMGLYIIRYMKTSDLKHPLRFYLISIISDDNHKEGLKRNNIAAMEPDHYQIYFKSMKSIR